MNYLLKSKKIAKNYKTYRDRHRSTKYNVNDRIRAKEMLVISPDGEQLGVLQKSEALAKAEEYGLDLVEVAPGAKPPVAKIISFSKFKYEQDKKKKSNKKKSQEQKEIWFKAFIEEGDIDHKLKKVEEFIEEKNTVKLTVKRRGRVSREQMKSLMDKLLERTSEYSRILNTPKFSGPHYSAVIGPE